MRIWVSSIQWRIFVYYTVLFATAIALLASVHFWMEWNGAKQLADLRMREMGFQLLPFVFPPPENAPEPSADLAKLFVRHGPAKNEVFHRRVKEAEAKGIFVLVVNWQGEELYRSSNAPGDFRVRVTPGVSWELLAPAAVFGVAVPSIVGDVVALGTPLLRVEDPLLRRLPFSAAFTLLVIAGFSFLGFHLIRNALLPIREISRTAVRIASGDLSGRIALPSNGSELGQLALVLNTTFDRLGELLRRQREFIADISHELRTPVAIILAESEFARKAERTPERYHETVATCHRSALHMREIIGDLLLLSRFDESESVRNALRLEPCDLAEIAERARALAAPMAREREIAITCDLAPAPAQGEPKRLAHIILNLLTNAIRYNTPGGSVHLRTGCLGEGEGEVFLEVRDTGIGIPEEKLGRVFDRFYRVEESRNDTLGGTGLGLAICKAIVEAHGGRIEVASRVGEGSTFRVTLRK